MRDACTAQSSAEASGAGTAAGKAACVTMAEACLTCPTGCQIAIDAFYADCDGTPGWDALKADTKTAMGRLNCDGAAASAPALFVLAAAVSPPNIRSRSRESPWLSTNCQANSLWRTRAQVVNHFLN